MYNLRKTARRKERKDRFPCGSWVQLYKHVTWANKNELKDIGIIIEEPRENSSMRRVALRSQKYTVMLVYDTSHMKEFIPTKKHLNDYMIAVMKR